MSSTTVFATLTPANVEASLAFHAAFEQCMSQHDKPNFYRFMSLKSSKKTYNHEVSLFLRRSMFPQGDPEDAASDTATEYDTDNGTDESRPGMVWEGNFKFDLDVLPSHPDVGWKIGRSAGELLTPNRWSSGIRNEHAIFSINTETGHMRIVSRGTDAGPSQVTVNGRAVLRGDVHALNQCDMNVKLGPLAFVFTYTDFAHTEKFMKQRQNYIGQFLGVEVPIDMSPTPSDSVRTFGSWTLNGALGKGTFGRVYHATNTKGMAAAVKLVESHPSRETVIMKEIQTLRELTALAEKEDDGGRFLRLHEVINQDGRPAGKWEDIGLVLRPVLAETFQDLLESKGRSSGRSPNIDMDLKLFLDALRGVAFLHAHNWLHGDLKPANIGIKGQRAVLLDIDGAVHLTTDTLEASPGKNGTIGYLSPEREMQPYGLEADMWSMGVTGYQLIKGRHPWAISVNPWRPGSEFEEKRGLFESKYKSAMSGLGDEATSFESLLMEMLRYQWGRVNTGSRITIHDAVLHPCWETDGPRTKRSR